MTSRSIYSLEPAKGWLPWGAFAPILCILLVAVPALTVSEIEQRFGLVDERGNPNGIAGLYSVLLFEFAAAGLLLLAWVRFVERRSFATIGLGAERGVGRTRSFVDGLAIGWATSFAVVAAIWVAGGYRVEEWFPAFSTPTAVAKIGFLLLCFVVQSSVEEMLFRGWLLSAVARKFNVPAAVALTSIVFAFLHYSPRQPWLVTLVSFLFSLFTCAWALHASRQGKGIWGVMGWHAGWNWWIAVGFDVPITGLDAGLPALLVRLVPDGPDSLTGGAEGPEGSYLCNLFFLVAIGFLIWRDRRRGARAAAELAGDGAELAGSSAET